MRITETRKAIIELIEAYMDKTLSEGCLIEFLDRIRVVSYVEEIGVKYFGKDGEIYGIEHRHFDILGHYDITAVLKYIYDKCEEGKGYESYQGDKFLIEIYSDDIEEDNTWAFPNKPLHIYTEEEDKQLLDLLLKLKTNDI